MPSWHGDRWTGDRLDLLMLTLRSALSSVIPAVLTLLDVGGVISHSSSVGGCEIRKPRSWHWMVGVLLGQNMSLSCLSSLLLESHLCYPRGNQLSMENLSRLLQISWFLMLLNANCRKDSKSLGNSFMNWWLERRAGQWVDRTASLEVVTEQRFRNAGTILNFKQNNS